MTPGSAFRLALVLGGLLTGCASVPAAVELPAPDAPRQSAAAAEIELGRQIYRAGRMADGSPVRALVMGDVPVLGTQFTCLHCHRNSGLGVSEGTKNVMPTDGRSLYAPRTGLYHPRPAYSDETLARVLRNGLDPGGNLLDPTMPVYDLPEREMSALIAYLKTLAHEPSPGVDERAIHFAVVVSEGLDPVERDAMLAVIDAYVGDVNGQSRRGERRSQVGFFYHEYKNKAYRTWKVHVWELKGPAESWPAQLEAYYRARPVFALLSGRVDGPWEPVHRFCEEQRLPALLPNTERPVVRDPSDLYTLYFSAGFGLEGRLILAHLAAGAPAGELLQIYRPGTPGADAARELRAALTDFPGWRLRDLILAPDQLPDLQSLSGGEAPTAIACWLTAEELETLTGLPATTPLYLSSTLLERRLEQVPASLRRQARLIHPYVLPEDEAFRFTRAGAWLQGNGIAPTTPWLQGQTFFACTILREGLMHIKRHFYRDYLLDILGHTSRMAPYASNYPRLSFGPDQAYLAKGGYVIDLAGWREGAPTPATWLVP